jgi:hypothetical protein
MTHLSTFTPLFDSNTVTREDLVTEIARWPHHQTYRQLVAVVASMCGFDPITEGDLYDYYNRTTFALTRWTDKFSLPVGFIKSKHEIVRVVDVSGNTAKFNLVWRGPRPLPEQLLKIIKQHGFVRIYAIESPT